MPQNIYYRNKVKCKFLILLMFSFLNSKMFRLTAYKVVNGKSGQGRHLNTYTFCLNTSCLNGVRFHPGQMEKFIIFQQCSIQAEDNTGHTICIIHSTNLKMFKFS